MKIESLSVVIPAYNEETGIVAVVRKVHDFLSANVKDCEIILVCDGCSDRTAEVVAAIPGVPVTIIRNVVNRGKGFCVRCGVEAATKDFILMSDADLSTPIEEVLGFAGLFAEGYDIVIGSRARPDSQLVVRQGFLRRTMGKTFNLLVKILLFRGINDTQCGFKCFRAAAAKKVFSLQRIERFCFDVEVIFLAREYGFRVKEVGVKWANREASRVAVVRDSLNMFLDLFRIRMNAWKGFYDIKA